VSVAAVPQLIQQHDELEALCARLRLAGHVAVDTEFIRDRSYFARTCLVQLATEDEIALVDPLALPGMEPLRAVMLAPEVVKVLHAGRQDLEIFFGLYGEVPAPIFDTQVAAALLGLGDQVGQAPLVEKLLGVVLDKAGRLTDWARRPLSPDQLRYAAADVAYLLPLQRMLAGQLEERGRLDWLERELQAQLDPALYTPDPQGAWRGLKGVAGLRGAARGVAREVAAWREERAMHLDRPRRWVLGDDAILEIARRAPRTKDDLLRVRGLGDVARGEADALLARVAQAADSQEPREPAPRRSAMTPEADALADLLGCLVKLRARERGVATGQLATRTQLEEVALHGERAQVPVLEGWRREIVGDDLLRLREGSLSLVVRDGLVEIEG
jgi:ribonuclease D